MAPGATVIGRSSSRSTGWAPDQHEDAHNLLRALRDRGALDARYHPAVDRLDRLFSQSPG